MTDLRDKIVGTLNIEGAFCGTCDREPGSSLYCKTCVLVLNGYADAILAVIDLDKVRAKAQVEALREAADPFQNVTGSDTPVFSPAVADYLHARANRIAREAGIETGEEAGA